MALKRIQRRTRATRKKPGQEPLKHNYQQKQCTKVEFNDEKTRIIVQEIKFARLLANNDKRVRDKVFKRLGKWLKVRSQSSVAFSEEDFMSLWKGLFYCMWMSDKMLVQEELAESLSKLVHYFNSKDTIVLYTTCCLKTLATEWFGIDQHRLDKFSMLVRRILRQTFMVCKDRSWNIQWVTDISNIFKELFLHPKTGLGFSLHVTDIYLEELAKVSCGDLPEDALYEFVRPFVVYLITTNDKRQVKHIMQRVFRYLILQSDVGMEYMEKFKAWHEAGFPCPNLNDMVKLETSDTEENIEDEQLSSTENQCEKPLDPRAGRVDVELSPIVFNPKEMVQMLSEYKFHPSSTAQTRRQLTRLIEEFRELSCGNMPIGIKQIRIPKVKDRDRKSKKAAYRLLQFEKDLFSDKVDKKHLKSRNKQLIETDTCNTSPAACSQDESISEFNPNTDKNESIDSKNKSVDILMKAGSGSQNIDFVPSNKQKTSLIRKKPGNEDACIEKNKKTKTKSLSNKSRKIKKAQSKRLNSLHVIHKDVQHKTKKRSNELQVPDDANQSIFSSQISQNKNLLDGNDNKSKQRNKQTISENSIPQDKKITLLKNKLTKQVKNFHNLNNSMVSKKKVKIALQRNTAQHTSEYIKQIRQSPAIPFDANKKPLVSVLKPGCIPSPINPFYKKKLRS